MEKKYFSAIEQFLKKRRQAIPIRPFDPEKVGWSSAVRADDPSLPVMNRGFLKNFGLSLGILGRVAICRHPPGSLIPRGLTKFQ